MGTLADRRLRGWLVAWTLFVAPYAIALPFDGLSSDLVGIAFPIAPLVAAIHSGRAALAKKDRRQGGWFFLTIFLVAWLAAELAYSWHALVLDEITPVPSLADPFYYLGYGFLTLGLFTFLSGDPGRQFTALLDAVAVVAVVGTMSVQFLVIPAAGEESRLASLTALGYPLCDLALVVVVCTRLYTHRIAVGPSLRLIGAAAFILTITDSIYTFMVTHSGYDLEVSPLDIGWLASYACFSLAALRAHYEEPLEAVSIIQSRVGRMGPILAVIPLLGAVSLQAFDSGISGLLLAGSWVALGALFVRQVLTIRLNDRLAGTLESSERHLHEVLEHLDVGVLVFQPDARLQFANHTALAMLGLSPHQVEGIEQAPPQWRATDFDGNELALASLPFARALADGESIRGSLVSVACPGFAERRWISANADARRDGDGRLAEVVCTLTDVTTQVEAQAAAGSNEAVWKAMFESSPDALFILEPDGECDYPRIAACNRAAEAINGYGPGELAGQSSGVLVGPSLKGERAVALLAEARERRLLRFETEAFRLDGSSFMAEVTISPIPHRDREIYFCQSRDTTERKRQTEALIHSQKLESLGVLAAGIAHDFNNVLTTIMGNIGVARRLPGLAEEASEALSDAELAGRHAGELVRQMLDYSGKSHRRDSLVDVDLAIVEMRRLIATSLAPGVTLELDLGSDRCRVAGDATQLRQAVISLVMNAVESIEDGQGVVRVRTYPVTPVLGELESPQFPGPFLATDYVLVEVSDDGKGIAHDHLDRVFEPFFTTKFAGRGLGLAAVLGIVRSHGGAMRVFSEPGLGACFRIYLPVATAEAEEAA